MATSPLLIVFLAAGLSGQAPAKASSWTTYTSKDGEFQVDFPARPQEQSRAIPGAMSAQQQTYTARSGGCQFMVTRVRYPRPFPPNQITNWLSERRRDLLNGQVQLVRESDIAIDDIAGQHLEYRTPSPRANGFITVVTRHFVKGSSYYVVTAMSAPGRELPREADVFLDSFRLAKAGAAAKGAPASKAGTPAKASPGMAARPAPAAGGGARTSYPDANPEDALRTFMVATVARDEAALRAITLPDPEVVWLLGGPPASPETVEQMRSLVAEMKIRRLKSGDEVAMPHGGTATLGPLETTGDRAMLLPEGAPEPVRLRKVDGHWKVDARPAIAARKAEASQRSRPR